MWSLQSELTHSVRDSFLNFQTVVKNRYPREEVRQKVRAEFLQSLTQLLGAASTKDNPHPLLRCSLLVKFNL